MEGLKYYHDKNFSGDKISDIRSLCFYSKQTVHQIWHCGQTIWSFVALEQERDGCRLVRPLVVEDTNTARVSSLWIILKEWVFATINCRIESLLTIDLCNVSSPVSQAGKKWAFWIWMTLTTHLSWAFRLSDNSVMTLVRPCGWEANRN